jgi:hypothetical protein
MKKYEPITLAEYEQLRKYILDTVKEIIENSAEERIDDAMEKRNIRYELNSLESEASIHIHYDIEMSAGLLKVELRRIRRNMRVPK